MPFTPLDIIFQVIPAFLIYGWAIYEVIRSHRQRQFDKQIADMVPRFCHHPTTCKRAHKVVIVAPPNKPFRIVLKHTEESHGRNLSRTTH